MSRTPSPRPQHAIRGARAPGLLLLGAVALGAVAAGAGPASAAPAHCPKGKVTLISGGARTCVSPGAFRQRGNTLSRGAQEVRAALEGRPVRMRQKNGRVVADQIPDRLAAALARAYDRKERELAAAVAAARAGGVSQSTAVTITEGPGRPVTTNADGSVSGSASITASEGGKSLTAEFSVTGRASGSLDVGVDITFDAGAGQVSSRGFLIRDVNTAPRVTCPTAAGKISLDDAFGGTIRNAETFGGARVRLGAVHEATTLNVRSSARAQMSADARLTPFTVSISASLDYSRTAQALAFFSARSRAVGSGSMTATVNPVSGAVSGATVTTSSRLSGFSGPSTGNELDGSLRKIMDDEAGRILTRLREIEKRARSGGCTRLVFEPGSPATMKPKAKQRVVARLETDPGGAKVPVVRWRATPVKGSVAPRSSSAAAPALTVTGAAAGPLVARVDVKAVSPAGISTGAWIANGEGFPPSYSGTVSFQTPGLGGVQSETWNGVVTYTNPDELTNPDGTRTATYHLTSATIATHVGAGLCSWTSGPGTNIKFGDLEIRVSPAGAWSSAFVVDVQMPTVPFSCPPAPSQPGTPKAFLNTRTTTAGLRPMPENGPITGTGVTDTSATTLVPSTASWSLSPG